MTASRENRCRQSSSLQHRVWKFLPSADNACLIRPGNTSPAPAGAWVQLRQNGKRTGVKYLTKKDLPPAAEEAGFDVLITTDTNIPYQQTSTAETWRS